MKRAMWLSAAVVGAAALALAVGPSYSRHDVAKGFDPTKLGNVQEELLSGFAASELFPASLTSHAPVSFTTKGSQDCGGNIGSNTKVNQDCLNISDGTLQGRGQAQNETAVAIDPTNSKNVVASQNDYRRGDGNCYTEWSSNGGATWNDSTDPMGFTVGSAFGGAREYWQAGGDTSVAFDSKGNAYLSCQVFMRGPGTTNPDVSSGFLVFRSQNHGASWNFPGRYVRVSNDVSGSGTQPFLDKQYMTVDNHAGSPFQDRIYVTWTEFTADGTAYIYEAHSSDYGEHFSPPVLVSGDNATLCTQTYGLPTPHGHCNENQFSNPFVGSDGNLYVAWDNYNNSVSGNENWNQILLAKSTDGGATFSTPVRVSKYYDLPDCATYQGGADLGRACVPEKGSTTYSIFRATNYPSGAVDPTDASKVVVTFGSYINKHSNESNGCTPDGFSSTTGQNLFTGVKTPGACNNDILISVSTNGGTSFTGGSTDPRDMPVVTQDAGQATTDQFWQWEAFTKNGKLAVSYYDRQYGDDETTGSMDFSLSGSSSLSSFGTARVTSSSMPPPTQFSGLFFGDYTGLAAASNAIPVWMDTRNLDLFYCTPSGSPSLCTGTEGSFQAGLTANDQDIYAASMGVPGK
jgi:hypothetical protein